jgi:hypothetical protein
MVSFTPLAFYPQRKKPWYHLDRRLGGAQRKSGCGGDEKNPQSLPGLETPIIQPVAQRYITELSRVKSNKDSNKIQIDISKVNELFLSSMCFTRAATGPRSEADESNPRLTTTRSIYHHSPIHIQSPKWFLHFRFLEQNFVCISHL